MTLKKDEFRQISEEEAIEGKEVWVRDNLSETNGTIFYDRGLIQKKTDGGYDITMHQSFPRNPVELSDIYVTNEVIPLYVPYSQETLSDFIYHFLGKQIRKRNDYKAVALLVEISIHCSYGVLCSLMFPDGIFKDYDTSELLGNFETMDGDVIGEEISFFTVIKEG